MARYREGISVGSFQRETPLVGYVPPVDSNAWRAMLREPERDQSGGLRFGPFRFNDADRTEGLRSNTMGFGPQQYARMPDLGPLREGPRSGQQEFGILDHGMLKERPHPLDWKDRDLRLLDDLSNDRLSYLNHTRDLPSYSELCRERELKAYPSLSRERESHFNLPSERAAYPDGSPFQKPVRDLPSLMSLGSNSSSLDQRINRLMDIGRKYSRRLSPYDLLTEERSPYSNLTRNLNDMATARDIGGIPHSSLSAYRESRSRSPLGNRVLPSLVPDRCQSPYSTERSPFLQNLSQHGVLEGGSSRSVQPMQKGGSLGDTKPMTGSVVRVDGLPAENKAGCIAQLFDRLVEYGEVTDVQLHTESGRDYALFFYSGTNGAYIALRGVEKNPLFSRSLKLSLWVLVADTDRPITLALTRVMYIENLDKKVTSEMLHKLGAKVGEILDIEIKETPGKFFNTAIVQYWDAGNAQLAAQSLNLVKIGKSIIKTISGKNKPSNCVWIDGIPKDLDKRDLTDHFEEYGHIDKYVFDRQRGAALILFPARVPARQCVRYLENGKTTLGGKVIRADYANERAQLAFCKAMEQSGQNVGDFLYA